MTQNGETEIKQRDEAENFVTFWFAVMNIKKLK